MGIAIDETNKSGNIIQVGEGEQSTPVEEKKTSSSPTVTGKFISVNPDGNNKISNGDNEKVKVAFKESVEKKSSSGDEKPIISSGESSKPIIECKVKLESSDQSLKKPDIKFRKTQPKEDIRADHKGIDWIKSNIKIDSTVLTHQGRLNCFERAVDNLFQKLFKVFNVGVLTDDALVKCKKEVKESFKKDKDAVFAFARLGPEQTKAVIDRKVSESCPMLSKKDANKVAKAIYEAMDGCVPTLSGNKLSIVDANYVLFGSKMGEGSGADLLFFKNEKNENDCVVLKAFKPTTSNQDFSHEYDWKTLIKEAEAHHYAVGRDDIQHQNIANFKGMGKNENGGAYFSLQEYVKGPDLTHYLNNELNNIHDKNDTSNVNKYMANQIVDAVQHLHDKRGMLHLDLKTNNIMIDEKSGNVKLIDFGISETKQKANTSAGTPSYFPPEIDRTSNKIKELSKKEYLTGETDQRGDIYSLGIVLANIYGLQEDLICINLPKEPLTSFAKDYIEKGEMSIDKMLEKGVPEDAARVINAMTKLDINERVESLNELRMKVPLFFEWDKGKKEAAQELLKKSFS